MFIHIFTTKSSLQTTFILIITISYSLQQRGEFYEEGNGEILDFTSANVITKNISAHRFYNVLNADVISIHRYGVVGVGSDLLLRDCPFSNFEALFSPTLYVAPFWIPSTNGTVRYLLRTKDELGENDVIENCTIIEEEMSINITNCTTVNETIIDCNGTIIDGICNETICNETIHENCTNVNNNETFVEGSGDNETLVEGSGDNETFVENGGDNGNTDGGEEELEESIQPVFFSQNSDLIETNEENGDEIAIIGDLDEEGNNSVCNGTHFPNGTLCNETVIIADNTTNCNGTHFPNGTLCNETVIISDNTTNCNGTHFPNGTLCNETVIIADNTTNCNGTHFPNGTLCNETVIISDNTTNCNGTHFPNGTLCNETVIIPDNTTNCNGTHFPNGTLCNETVIIPDNTTNCNGTHFPNGTLCNGTICINETVTLKKNVTVCENITTVNFTLSDLNRMVKEINMAYHDDETHELLHIDDVNRVAFITWDRMFHTENQPRTQVNRNSFQLVLLILNNGNTYAFFIYRLLDYELVFNLNNADTDALCGNKALIGLGTSIIPTNLLLSSLNFDSSRKIAAIYSNIHNHEELGRYVFKLWIPAANQPMPPTMNCQGDNPDEKICQLTTVNNENNEEDSAAFAFADVENSAAFASADVENSAALAPEVVESNTNANIENIKQEIVDAIKEDIFEFHPRPPFRVLDPEESGDYSEYIEKVTSSMSTRTPSTESEPLTERPPINSRTTTPFTERPVDSQTPTSFTDRPIDSRTPTSFTERPVDSQTPTPFTDHPINSRTPTSFTERPIDSRTPTSFTERPVDSQTPTSFTEHPIESSQTPTTFTDRSTGDITRTTPRPTQDPHLIDEFNLRLSKEFCLWRDAGLYQHPLFCDQFLVCGVLGSRADLKKCKPGLNYNPVLSVCDWKSNFECNPLRNVQVKSRGFTTSSPQRTIHKNICLLRGWSNTPDPSTCDHYLACTNTRTIRMKCPEGLYFRVTADGNGQCDYQQNVRCIDGRRFGEEEEIEEIAS